MTLNEKNIKMVLCKFIQSLRKEMARDTVLNNHEPRTTNHEPLAHSLYTADCTKTVPVYDVYVPIIMYIAHAWGVPLQKSCLSLWDLEYNVISFNFNLQA